ncbi:hypothetical protein M6B38_148725 [Iris pallida]|uniref:Uncharacterized protein n=1 Tax=Iris pallida TaxID=29817 RepID=A0AAX6F9F8_IRIPA|nr:hypothetical protein M6B38_148725 [Iris pallida]
MSTTGKGVASSMAQGAAAKVQQQQQQKVNSPAMPRNKARANRGSEFEAALPEWKLNCLCADYGIPPTMRGNLHMGGCSF